MEGSSERDAQEAQDAHESHDHDHDHDNEHGHEHQGDDEQLGGAVLCPHCKGELPPLPRPALSNLNLSSPSIATSAPSPIEVRPVESTTPGLLAPPHSAPPRPQITTASLKHSLDESEDAETSATSAIISADDIRRWSAIAGVHVIPSPAASPATSPVKSSTAAGPSKSIPLIPPPPSSKQSTGRFGFFRGRSKLGMNDDDSDDDSGGATGYAALAGPGSDDDDDGYESDKPFTPKRKEVEEGTDEKETVRIDTDPPTISVTNSITPETPVDDLRKILSEVLTRVQVLSSSHTELLASHSELLTSMKIARSNLVMAEANSEMLEDELKRLKAPSQPGSARSSATPDAPRDSLDKSKDGARSRPSSVQLPPGSYLATGHASSAPKSSGFGFWKKATTGGESPTEPTAPAPIEREEEVRQLRAQLENQSDELEALKKGKKAIEAELEGLSQALFEEANKMVSDERRRRAELEDSLREVKSEREALRQTVKVLGGRVQTPAPGGTPSGELSENEAIGSLDAHYEALRRGIHHAVDGPSPLPSDDELGSEPEFEGRQRSDTVTTLKPNGGDTPTMTLETGIPETTAPLATEPNPWG